MDTGAPPVAARGPLAKPPTFGEALLFAVLTLGLYRFWYHPRRHAELARYLGRPNRLKHVWHAYVFLMIVGALFALFVLLPAAIEYQEVHGAFDGRFSMVQDEPDATVPVDPQPFWEPQSQTLLDFLRASGYLYLVVAFMVAAVALFSTFVIGQNRLLHEARGEPHHGTAGGVTFLMLYYGQWLISTLLDPPFIFALLLLGILILAYYLLHTAYTDFWQRVAPDPRKGAIKAVSASTTSESMRGTCSLCGASLHYGPTHGSVMQATCSQCGARMTIEPGRSDVDGPPTGPAAPGKAEV